MDAEVRINDIYKRLEKIDDDIWKFRHETKLTAHEQAACKLLQGSVKAAASLAFALGNLQDPTG